MTLGRMRFSSVAALPLYKNTAVPYSWNTSSGAGVLLLGYFDYYVSSSVAGYRKPNCKGLQMISERFSFPITELIFIGDEEKDRRTAMNANCKFIWIQRIEKNKESIDNLNQLLQVLE